MDVENVIYIFAYNFANVGMKPVCKGWNIFVHLYNKKVLKYGEQDVIFVNLVWVIVEVPLLNKLSKQWIHLFIKGTLGFISRKNIFKIMDGVMPREQNSDHQISLGGPV